MTLWPSSFFLFDVGVLFQARKKCLLQYFLSIIHWLVCFFQARELKRIHSKQTVYDVILHINLYNNFFSTNELITIDTKGLIKCFRQTSADQMTFHHEASVRRYYPKGVYSCISIEKHGILLVSGALEMDSTLDSSNVLIIFYAYT